MYSQTTDRIATGRPAGRWNGRFLTLAAWCAAATLAIAQEAPSSVDGSLAIQASAEFGSADVVRRISRESERLELSTNTSRILTLDKRIPRVQVNNPELLAVTPLSATQIQIAAKKAGVTQVNLWDEDKQIHTVDVIIYGDIRELEYALKTQFPNSSVGAKRFSQSLILTGFVDSPDHVSPIMRLAEDYAPKVINNLQVGGVQQVVLKVKIFEVSRTKLRRMGFDFAQVSGSGGFAASAPAGLLSEVTNSVGSVQSLADASGHTFEFGIVSGGNAFFGFIDALQQQNIAKILAEPNIVAVSGRPAQFLEGGEIPILVPQSLGTSSIEYKPFGTQVDFLPIVLGNGNIRLEVRPRVSDLDQSIGIVLQNQIIPGLRVRHVETAVEMKAGQTFALAGLIQQRKEGSVRGLPFLSDLPGVGAAFRKTEETTNEIELLVLVTPEFVDAMEPHEVPQCLPGQGTMSPSNKELYFGGHLEVPDTCSPCGTPAAGCECGPKCCPPIGFGGTSAMPAEQSIPMYSPPPTGYGPSLAPGATMSEPTAPGMETIESGPVHGELYMPTPAGPQSRINPSNGTTVAGATAPRPTSVPRHYTPQLAPQYERMATRPAPQPAGRSGGNGNSVLVGGMGYDVE